MEQLAIFGSTPVRESPIFYGKQCIEQDDIDAVVETLKGPLITCGPRVEALEEKLARGIIWAGVQGLGFLFSAALCLIATRAALKRRKNTREKRKNHENTAFDTERY